MGTPLVSPCRLRKGHSWIGRPAILRDEPRRGGHPDGKCSPRRQEAGRQAAKWTFGVSAQPSASVGLNCRVKHFNSPSRPGRITWPEGLPEHRGRQASTRPRLSGEFTAFAGKRLGASA